MGPGTSGSQGTGVSPKNRQGCAGQPLELLYILRQTWMVGKEALERFGIRKIIIIINAKGTKGKQQK